MDKSNSSRNDIPFQRGFTMVELITIMVIAGILAAVAAPRFFDNNVFQSRGFADEVVASLRYAQKIAIAQRRTVCVAFAADSVTLTIDSDIPADGACNPAPAGNVQTPTGGPAYVVTAPAGVTFAVVPAGFGFDALGVPSFVAPLAINIAGATNGITIESGTGYVHSP
ncbi:MAG TPA: prepilin-type N-terminal cleavage/methylation domain-containing protein [Gallionella sp.]|nr:prepilin-type N-terminal cleavage/methylation domain-containing protein [Gallionella sp.]